MCAHEHILTAVQTIFTEAGYRTDRKNVPHIRGLKKADLVIKNFWLAGVRNVILDVSLRHEFRVSSADPHRNGEASHADVNGALSRPPSKRSSALFESWVKGSRMPIRVK
jgi:hypothetical protein